MELMATGIASSITEFWEVSLVALVKDLTFSVPVESLQYRTVYPSFYEPKFKVTTKQKYLSCMGGCWQYYLDYMYI